MKFDDKKYFRPKLSDLVFGGKVYIGVVIYEPEQDGYGSYVECPVTPEIYEQLNFDTSTGYSIPQCMFLKYLTADDIEACGFAKLNGAPFYTQSVTEAVVHWFQKDRWVYRSGRRG